MQGRDVQRFAPLVAWLIVGALTLTSADAATFTVTNTNDSGAGSLRDSINAANLAAGPDTIVFQAGVAGTIQLTSELLIRSNLTIFGPGSSIVNVRRSGSAFFRVLNILDFAGGATGGIFVNISGLTVSNGHVDSNSFPSNSGGGIFNDQFCTLALTNCTIEDNTAVNRWQSGAGGAGGIYNGGVLTLANCTVSSNSATAGFLAVASGGGITNVGTLTVRESSINSNSSPNGSGIHNLGPLTVLNSTFEFNSSITIGFGGGISHGSGSATVQNSTFASNANAGRGGGVAVFGAATLQLLSCTFSRNSAPAGNGDSIYVEIGSVTLTNTIVYNDSAFFPKPNLAAVGGTISSGGYNLSDDNGSGFLNAATDLINTLPNFDTFGPQDNGGPTRTIALLGGSPALDKGRSFGLTTDQRLLSRPFDNPAIPNAIGGDGSDIGAYEAREALQGGAALVVTTTADHNDGVCGTIDCTLREAILRANTVSAVNAITFAPNVIGVITLLTAQGGQLTITDSVTITGPGARVLAIGSNIQSRLLTLTGGISVISGLTFRDGFMAGGAAGGSNVGGAVLNQAAVTFRDCTFRDNRASGSSGVPPGGSGGSGSGGAIANVGTLTVERCTFNANGATGGFGADNPPPDEFILTSGGNGGAGRGAAIYNDVGQNLTVSNCTFVSNNAGGAGAGSGHFGGAGGAGQGGAICNLGSMVVTGATFSSNGGFGGSGGLGRFSFLDGPRGRGIGGLAAVGGTSTARNTISANNTGNNGGGGDVDGAFVSQGYNLIRIGDFSSGFNQIGDQVGTTAAPINAVLGPLQNNGGGTDTMRVLAGSPALDQGKAFNLLIDQRSQPRPNDNPAVPNASGGDGSEIGAFEISGTVLIVTTTADHNDGSCDAIDCTLREAITAANAQVDSDVIRFAPGVTGTIQLASALPALSTDMTLEGHGANLLTVRRNTGGDYRIFTIENGAVTLKGLTISNGFLPASGNLGGGIYNDGGTLIVTNCALTGNHAYAGGGFYNAGANDASATLTGCTLSGNSAFEGGGIDNAAIGGNAILIISNSTLSGNTASNNGGGISNGTLGGSVSLTLTNCTFSGNSAPTGGGMNNGVFFGGSATVMVRNTIFKTGASGANLANSSGVITSQGSNRSNDGGGGFLVGSGDLNNTDPMLGTLQDNGGPTFTHALLPGSNAINNGNGGLAPSVDQRGYGRNGASDIGAFEFGGVPPLPPAASGAVSRKLHGGIPFDINLPLSGSSGVECRSGGAGNDYQVVVGFVNAVTFTSASVSSGVGSVSSSAGNGTNTITVNLTGITSGQTITMTLAGVNDGVNTGNVSIPLGLLVGDGNGDRIVNAGDAVQTRGRSGQGADASNFRSDANADGFVNSGDALLVRSRSGNFLP